MTLQQLRLFTTVAQLENMSRAAELLHMSQSALSKNIAKLEAEIGAPLFSRSGKKIELNAAGTGFLECCNLVLRNLDAAVEEIRLSSGGNDSRIRIGTVGNCGPVIRCMAAFGRENPGTEFDLNSAVETEDHVDINDYDMLVYPAGIKYEKFSGYRLCREKYLLAVPAGHPLAGSSTITPKKLTGQDFVFLRTGHDRIEPAYELCAALALQFRSQCFADSRELHRQMVASGLAMGFVPEGEAEAYRADKRIALLQVSDARFSRELMVCFRKEKHLTERGRAFMDYTIRFFGLKEET